MKGGGPGCSDVEIVTEIRTRTDRRRAAVEGRVSTSGRSQQARPQSGGHGTRQRNSKRYATHLEPLGVDNDRKIRALIHARRVRRCRFSEETMPRGESRQKHSHGRVNHVGKPHGEHDGKWRSRLPLSRFNPTPAMHFSTAPRCTFQPAFTSFNAALDVLPHRSQITRGGGPRRSTMFAKSASLVMTVALAARAAAKMGGSSASRSPRSRTEAHSTAKLSAIHRAMDGER